VIAGSVNLKQNSAQFRPFGMLFKVPTPSAPQAGDYSVEVRDANGVALTNIAFKPLVPTPEPKPSDVGSFSIALAVNPNYKQAVVLHNGAILASRSASAHAPVVEIVYPNGGENLTEEEILLKWKGSDDDGDQLTYTIQFSPDGGQTWEVLGVNWDQETYPISQQYFKGTVNGFIRVIASDGFNNGSNISKAPFSVPNHAPSVAIESPTPNYLFTGPQQVIFKARAADAEDGALPNDNLKWTSSLDGALGTGLEVQRAANKLSEGRHVITFSAADRGGLASAQLINIMVQRDVPSNLADLELSVAAPKQVLANTNFSYTVTVANRGPSLAKSVKVTNSLPSGFAFVSTGGATIDCTQSDREAVCSLGELASGASTNLTYSVRPAGTGPATLQLAAGGDVIEPNTANNSVEVSLTVAAPPTAAVALSIATTDGKIVISWPAAASDFVLEQTTSLATPLKWAAAAQTPLKIGDQNTVTISPPGRTQFFRLKKP
jgi:uncharacterized repeat protein (TIGR01451 family)